MSPESHTLDLSIPLGQTTIRILQISRGIVEQVPLHSHGAGHYEIHYLSSGHGNAVIDSQSYPVLSNTLYVTGPFVRHAQTASPDSILFEYCINLSAESPSYGSKSDPLSAAFLSRDIWYGQDRQNLLPLLENIFLEIKEKRIGYAEQIRALFTQCILALVRNYSESSSTEGQTTPSHFSYIPTPSPASDKTLLAEHYFLFEYSHLSLKELSDILGFSVRQTQRFLLTHYGKTFQEKKRESRMAAALLLLSSTDETITSISEKLGFSSMEYFSSSFRQYYKLSPQEYRKYFSP